jgi:AraC family transcriptional regulator
MPRRCGDGQSYVVCRKFAPEMHNPPDILSLAYRQSILPDQFSLLLEKERQIPGSVQYTISSYHQPPHWNMEDTGMLVYHFEKSSPSRNYLELRFCLERTETVDVLSFKFSPVHLSQFVKPRKGDSMLSDDVLNFRHRSSFTKILPLCGKTRLVLEGILNHTYSDSLENIYINAQTQMLLLYSMDCMLGDKQLDVINCKFLANEADREKITRSREILIQHIGEPITIKELSRKVAINECYLKKGFKEMFGTTIFDFYQSQRMEHAKYLLYEKGLSVTEVSLMLGYSSISHFSTAFKKHTGLKPCELLLR